MAQPTQETGPARLGPALMPHWLLAHSLYAYFGLAFAISWVLWLPLVATVQGWWDLDVPRWWHYTGAVGPSTAAVIVAYTTGGRAGLRQLLAQYAPRRAPFGGLIFAVAMPVALFMVAAVVIRVTDGAWPTSGQLSTTDNLPYAGLLLVLLTHVLTFGVGEETGWRGFALPRLQGDTPAMQATHRLAALWALWHIPTFFENESMMDMSPVQIAGWLAGLWMGAIFLTWLYNSSGGSLLVVVAWHGLFNFFAASSVSGTLGAIETIGVILVAIAAIQLAGVVDLTGFSPAGRRQRHEPLSSG